MRVKDSLNNLYKIKKSKLEKLNKEIELIEDLLAISDQPGGFLDLDIEEIYPVLEQLGY